MTWIGTICWLGFAVACSLVVDAVETRDPRVGDWCGLCGVALLLVAAALVVV
jgi:hypothetical protein